MSQDGQCACMSYGHNMRCLPSDLVQLEDEEGAVVVDAIRQLRVCFRDERGLVSLACPFALPTNQQSMHIIAFCFLAQLIRLPKHTRTVGSVGFSAESAQLSVEKLPM